MLCRLEKPVRNSDSDLQLLTRAGETVDTFETLWVCYIEHDNLTPDMADKLAKFLSNPTESPVVSMLKSDVDFEIANRPGVTDRSADELRDAACSLGLPELHVVTARAYRAKGANAQAIADALTNPVVEYAELGQITPQFAVGNEIAEGTEIINLDLDDAGLEALSQDRRLALNLAEMRVIRDFAKREGRGLTDAELEMLAQTWSEHCCHKTFRAAIDMHHDGARREVPGLLNIIRNATESCTKDWLISTFVDNAGIVVFDDEFEVSFKVETHNHPSALEPFGGANTGVGGVIRDIIGVSAKPIALTNVLCFGDQDASNLPDGALHPRDIKSGVVAGVADYGNKMGVPTVNGAVLYDAGYNANPLVYCGCVGIAPQGTHKRAPQVGDRIVSVGGKTGRDGLKGATFSSLDLDDSTAESDFATTAVQIGNPIVEKDAMEVVLRARDAGLYTAITDCGAGGFSSAVGEMSEDLGAHVSLEAVSLKYSGLRPWEVWLSEAQERIVMAIPPANMDALREICSRFDVVLDDLGYMTGDRMMRVTHGDVEVVNLPMDLLHEDTPKMQLKAEWTSPAITDYGIPDHDPAQVLLSLLADPNIASKEDIVRQYDHEVQGGAVVRPFAGKGPSDGAVFKPMGTKGNRAVALSNGIATGQQADPHRMAMSAIDEAMRNIVAVGADPDTVSILDNFCWGNPNLPDRLGGLVRAVEGCYDGARLFDVPYISGKDSLNNEYVEADGTRRPIPGTILISAMGMVPDLTRAMTSDLKAAGNSLLLVGRTEAHYGGAAIQELMQFGRDEVPNVREDALLYAQRVHALIKAGLIESCHDVSDGGIAVALAEMALAGGLGAEAPELGPEMFSESNTRWIIEVSPAYRAEVEAALDGMDFSYLGEVIPDPSVTLGKAKVSLTDINAAWRKH